MPKRRASSALVRSRRVELRSGRGVVLRRMSGTWNTFPVTIDAAFEIDSRLKPRDGNQRSEGEHSRELPDIASQD